MLYVQLVNSFGEGEVYGPYDSVTLSGACLRVDGRANLVSYDSRNYAWSKSTRGDAVQYKRVDILTELPVVVPKKGY